MVTAQYEILFSWEGFSDFDCLLVWFGLFFCCRSFEEVCSRVHNTLESLREVFSGLIVPTKDALVQLSFTAIQAVDSVRSPSSLELNLL